MFVIGEWYLKVEESKVILYIYMYVFFKKVFFNVI